MKPYEILEHTADIGLRIFGACPEELFKNGARGLYDLMTDMGKIRTRVRRRTQPTYRGRLRQVLRLRAQDFPSLFFDWLRELLFLFSSRRLVFVDFRFRRLEETALEVECLGGVFDARYDDQRVEIKAVTYHHFEVRRGPGGWRAKVIFDV